MERKKLCFLVGGFPQCLLCEVVCENGKTEPHARGVENSVRSDKGRDGKTEFEFYVVITLHPSNEPIISCVRVHYVSVSMLIGKARLGFEFHYVDVYDRRLFHSYTSPLHTQKKKNNDQWLRSVPNDSCFRVLIS